MGFRCTEKYSTRTEVGKFAVSLVPETGRFEWDTRQEGMFVESRAFSIANDVAGVDGFDSAFPQKENVSGLPTQQGFDVLRGLSYF